MSDSERMMSDDEDEQYQSDNSSMEDENQHVALENQQRLVIQKVKFDKKCRKKMIVNVQHIFSKIKTIPLETYSELFSQDIAMWNLSGIRSHIPLIPK